MIYTVTFNPALDYVVRLPAFEPGAVNRTESEDIQLGGKGINVSCVLGQLGFKSVASWRASPARPWRRGWPAGG